MLRIISIALFSRFNIILEMHPSYIETTFIIFAITFNFSVESKFAIDFCESTIHTTKDEKDAYIQLHCQSNEKYEYCGIGNMTKNAVRENCLFSKSKINQSNSLVLTDGRCNKDTFLSQLSFRGTQQSDINCIIGIKSFHNLGEQIRT